MTEKVKKDYSVLSADEATQLLSDLYQARTATLADPRKSPLRTLFNHAVSALILTDHKDAINLQDTVLAKNGIAKIEAENVCYNYLPEIVAAAEARGSKAAEGIKRYNNLTTLADTQARTTPGYKDMGRLAKMTLSIRLFKENALKI